MEVTLPEDTDPAIKRAFDESQRILGEAFAQVANASTKHSKEVRNRKYLAYSLKFGSLICAILITAGYLPHQLAIAIAVVYGVDTVLSNNKRLVFITQTANAYKAIENKLIRTHQTAQSSLLSESDEIKLAKKITALNQRLTKTVYTELQAVEQAVDQSDLETLQALSLDEEKLNLVMKQRKEEG